jgi:hypothetical protein
MNYLDEPFADSASLPQFILCMEVRKHATVAFPVMEVMKFLQVIISTMRSGRQEKDRWQEPCKDGYSALENHAEEQEQSFLDLFRQLTSVCRRSGAYCKRTLLALGLTFSATK